MVSGWTVLEKKCIRNSLHNDRLQWHEQMVIRLCFLKVLNHEQKRLLWFSGSFWTGAMKQNFLSEVILTRKHYFTFAISWIHVNMCFHVSTCANNQLLTVRFLTCDCWNRDVLANLKLLKFFPVKFNIN